MARFINPFTDWGFKRIFGQEYSKELLIAFLNELLLGDRHITDVKFKDKEQLPATRDHRGIVYDVFCETDTGEHIIVEMQNRSQPFIVDRSIFYASKAFTQQGQRGYVEAKEKSVAWDYRLTPVYMVCFMNFKPRLPTLREFRTDVVLANEATGELFSDRLHFIYLAMPLFRKTEAECDTLFDCWIYTLRHMEALERMPFEAQSKIFEKLAEIADSSTLTKEDREKYERSVEILWDNYAVLANAKEEGKKEGREEGKKEGREEGKKEGREEGKKEGREEGIEEGIIRTAKKMLSIKMPIATIMQVTNLSKDDIEKLMN